MANTDPLASSRSQRELHFVRPVLRSGRAEPGIEAGSSRATAAVPADSLGGSTKPAFSARACPPGCRAVRFGSPATRSSPAELVRSWGIGSGLRCTVTPERDPDRGRWCRGSPIPRPCAHRYPAPTCCKGEKLVASRENFPRFHCLDAGCSRRTFIMSNVTLLFVRLSAPISNGQAVLPDCSPAAAGSRARLLPPARCSRVSPAGAPQCS